MASNNAQNDLSRSQNQRPAFQDPFATIEGGVGTLTISTAISTSLASSAQGTTSGSNNTSNDASSNASSVSHTTPTSRHISPAKSPAVDDSEEEDALARSTFYFPRDNDYLGLDRLDNGRTVYAGPAGTLAFDRDVTPRQSNRSFDGAESVPDLRSETRLARVSARSISPTAGSVAGSVVSLLSAPDALYGEEWNIETLREMTDVVREALKAGSIPEGAMETLGEVLRAILVDEDATKSPVDIKLVAVSYFDKLLDAIVMSPKSRNIEKADPLFKDVYGKATALQHKWQQRFKEKYFLMDEYRISEMKEEVLRDMTLDVQDWKTDQPWVVSRNEPISQFEGHLGFEPGCWWLNLACAFRDGIVGGVHDMATKGQYSVTALPLLSGEEREGPTLNQVEYTKRGTIKEMPFGLITNKKGPVRVLRGHMLKSKFAPKIGVRYDGLYVMRQYGHRLVDENSNIYQCTLILERENGQKAMTEILEFPPPSKVDDWALYNRIVGDHIRARQGDVAYSEWREFQDTQKLEKEDFIQKEALQASFPKYRVVRRGDS